MDKQFQVAYGLRVYPHRTTVILNGVLASEPMTRALAVRAARVACGHRDGVTVWSNDDHGYRLYKRSAKRLNHRD